MVAFALPFSTIELIPSIVYSLEINLPSLAFFNVLAFLVIVVVGMVSGLKIISRKILFISGVYFVSLFLLIYIGNKGPGLIYLMGATFFAILIFPKQYAFLWSLSNVSVCGLMLIVV